MECRFGNELPPQRNEMHQRLHEVPILGLKGREIPPLTCDLHQTYQQFIGQWRGELYAKCEDWGAKT